MTATERTRVQQLALPVEKQVSWLYAIYPYVEARMDDKFQFRPELPIDAVIMVYLCPAQPGSRPMKNLTHYVGITGVGRDSAMLPPANPRCGFFAYERTLRRDDITDGLQWTLAVVETATDNGPWAIGGH